MMVTFKMWPFFDESWRIFENTAIKQKLRYTIIMCNSEDIQDEFDIYELKKEIKDDYY